MKKFSKKLKINKKTIANLNAMELYSVKGGSNYCTNNTFACVGPTYPCGKTKGGGGAATVAAYGCGNASNCGNGASSPIHCSSSVDVTCNGVTCNG